MSLAVRSSVIEVVRSVLVLKNWGILLAAPKKKTSHKKKRQRFLSNANNNVEFKNNLNRCPSCGHYKRSNTLCMFCVNQVRFLWKNHNKPEEIVKEVDRVVYPGKKDTQFIKKLKDKDSYLKKRMRTLPID
ncbi:hypothetical protein KAFR_0I02340 [Kazachstania africana CBS 2517]|uniref:Large ribosomal subunit protein bL32m n=1 Tax=Kazachstania africana (strain ATCC 22294 / BCRC 22015 / CBS 2517 / CECT 1963 / NBRC 1671 / NRRL Y-8276) TaxID=1071382 RepID=H2B063_KAZAF|nr:hypothetical protein KAFR_0I02340 [Kazachstania africana CBS 2517]CCF60013.1 hypothetical protein KAFR_0I02340 [Kazachstania africana CBS 2517]